MTTESDKFIKVYDDIRTFGIPTAKDSLTQASTATEKSNTCEEDALQLAPINTAQKLVL